MTGHRPAQTPDDTALLAQDPTIAITAEDYHRLVQSWARRAGRRAVFPRKLKPRLVALHHILSGFKRGVSFTEDEVNNIILKTNLFNIDHVQVRRHLVDYGMLGRKGDGSQYRVVRTYLALARWNSSIPGTDLFDAASVRQVEEG